MAPKGRQMKRPAAAVSASAAPAAKKSATSKAPAGFAKTLALVSKALTDVAGYPPEVLAVFDGCLPQCLGVAKETRHAFQARMVEMIGEVLKSSEAALQEKLTAADGCFSKVQEEKASRDGEQGSCETVVEEKAKAEEAAAVALEESTSALKAATAALSQAEQEQRVGDAELEAAAGKLAALTAAKADTYEALKEGTTTKVQADVQALMKLCSHLSFDASLLHALPGALAKAPADRSTFDGLVLGQAEAEFSNCAGALEETLATGDAGKSERAAKVASATAELEKGREAQQACRDALQAAKTDNKEAEVARKAAAKAAQALGPELKRAAAELQRATAALEDFRTGPLAAYHSLAERSAEPVADSKAETAEAETAEAEAGKAVAVEAEATPAEAAAELAPPVVEPASAA